MLLFAWLCLIVVFVWFVEFVLLFVLVGLWVIDCGVVLADCWAWVVYVVR